MLKFEDSRYIMSLMELRSIAFNQKCLEVKISFIYPNINFLTLLDQLPNWQLFSPFRIIKMNLKQVSDNGQRVTILFHARGNNQSLLVLIACKWKLK